MPNAIQPAFVTPVGSGALHSTPAPTISSTPTTMSSPPYRRLDIISVELIDRCASTAASCGALMTTRKPSISSA